MKRSNARGWLQGKKPNVKNRITPELKQTIVDLAFEQPAWKRTQEFSNIAGISPIHFCLDFTNPELYFEKKAR